MLGSKVVRRLPYERMPDSVNAKLANPAIEVPVFTCSKQESKLACFYSAN
jgi:hypothetical protein